MTVTLFGVDAGSVRANYYPHLSDFSANSVPTATDVETMVTRAAAKLEAKLLLESITASAITDVTSAAYYWCQEAIELQVAIRIAEVATGQDRGLLTVWRDEVKQKWADLDEGGAAALGGGATSTAASDPDGPTSHISENSLTTDSSADMSTTVPRLRRDDLL